jgi:hypothetical protein
MKAIPQNNSKLSFPSATISRPKDPAIPRTQLKIPTAKIFSKLSNRTSPKPLPHSISSGKP